MHDYQQLASSTQYGGARVVLTGMPTGVSVGRYTVPLERLPDARYGHVPAGTPMYMDDLRKRADIHYAFEVADGSTATKLRVKKGKEGSRIQVGMAIMVAPDDINDTGASVVVTAVDRSNDSYDELTHASLANSATAGTILVEANKADAAGEVKVKPNAFTFYDVVKLPNAFEVFVDGLFNQADGVLLENRIPPIAPAVRAYLASPTGGNTYMRYSKSKE